MEGNSSKEDLQKHLVQFLSEGCFKKISSMDFFFFNESFYLPIDDKSTELHGSQMGLSMYCFIFPISLRSVPEMEKNKALNFSEAKSGKMCVIHQTKDTGWTLVERTLGVNYGKFSDYVL